MPFLLPENAPLKEIQQEVVRLRSERHFKLDMMHIALMLCGEMGELMTQIRRTYVDGKEPLPKEDKSSLQHEIADVFIMLTALADKCGVDIEDAWRSKEKLNDSRTWGK